MSIANWVDDEQRYGGGFIEMNTHLMSGKPMGIPCDDAFEQPVPVLRKQWLKEQLSGLFPGQDIQIKGAPWDYTQSEDDDLRTTPIGDYRIQIGDGPEMVVCVNPFRDRHGAHALGAEVFDAYREAGIDVLDVAFLDNLGLGDSEQRVSKTMVEAGGYYLHFEAFRPDSKMLFNSKLNGRQEELGRLLGKMHCTAETLPDELKTRLKNYTDNITLRCVERGLEIFRDADGTVQKLLKQFSIDEGLLEDVEAIAKDQGRLATTFNFIDKMVGDNGPDKPFTVRSYDTVARGYCAKFNGASHDFGFGLSRIILNERLYDGDDKEQQILDGVRAFVDGYNQEKAGRALTVCDALKAAKLVAVFQFAFGTGYTDLSCDEAPGTQGDTERHVKQQLIPQLQGLEKYEARLVS